MKELMIWAAHYWSLVPHARHHNSPMQLSLQPSCTLVVAAGQHNS